MTKPWGVRHPGIGVLFYGSEEEAWVAAGTAGELIEHARGDGGVTELSATAVDAGAEALKALRREHASELVDDPNPWHREVRTVLEAALPLLKGAGDEQLTAAERAAVHADLHMATCPLEIPDCAQCLDKLGVIRRVIRAVTPVIEEEAAAMSATDP